MKVSSQPYVLPKTRRRAITNTDSPIYIDHTPIAVSNKIRAIRARKTLLNLDSINPDYTDIRPLNFGYGGMTNSRTNLSVITAERLVDRSKDLRLDRISTRQPPRPSVLSSTNTNHQSLLWLNYQGSIKSNKQLRAPSDSTIITSPAIRSTRNKFPDAKEPDIPRLRQRQPLTDRYNSLAPIKPTEKTKLKTKTSKIPIIKSVKTTENTKILTYEAQNNNNNNNDDYVGDNDDNNNENILKDNEFEEYLDKAMVKCAEWLTRYVFNEDFNQKHN